MASSEPPAVPVDEERPWHAAYPAPTAAASIVTREMVMSWMQAGRLPGKDFVLVDLRRTDYEVSLSCPLFEPFGAVRQSLPSMHEAQIL
jgi:hypothetical protein